MRHKEISHDNPIFSDQYLSQTKIFSSISSLNFLLEAISSVLVEKHFDEIHFCYLMSNEGRDLSLSLSVSLYLRQGVTDLLSCWVCSAPHLAGFLLTLWRHTYYGLSCPLQLSPRGPGFVWLVLFARHLRECSVLQSLVFSAPFPGPDLVIPVENTREHMLRCRVTARW